MKKLLLAACFLFGLSSAASAQTNAIKVNIFSPLVRTGSFFYEHKVSEHNSIQLGALYTNFGDDQTKFTGFAFTPEYRFYLSDSKPALEGFYFAPYLRYQNLTLTATEMDTPDGSAPMEAKASLNTYGGGLLAGYQMMFKHRFTLDAFLGPAYNNGNLKVTVGNDSQTFDAGSFLGFGLRTGVTFGLAF